MKGLMVEKLRSEYFTNMKDVFDAIGNIQTNYNWLITDYECNIYPSNKIPFNNPYIWIDGQTLANIVMENEIQFIWGVFSAFEKHISLNSVLNHKLPFADGNKELWDADIRIQNPLAEIEIISWDSGLLLVISKDEKIIDNFLKGYPNATDLAEYNRCK